MIPRMLRTLENTKHRIFAVTFIFLFALFLLFSLIDLNKRMSDYKFFAAEMNDYIEKAYDSEQYYINLRISNYIKSIIEENKVSEAVLKNEVESLRSTFDSVFYSFGKRTVPIFSLAVLNKNKEIIYQIDDGSFVAGTITASPSTINSINKGIASSGFETHGLPFHYTISTPIIDKNQGVACGAVALALNPSWFDFKLRWYLDNVKTAVYTKNKIQVEEFDFGKVEFFPLPEWYPQKVEEDIRFFQTIIEKIDVNKQSTDMKVGNEYYIINTFPLLRYDGEEVGKLLVAFDMSEFRDRQWGYFYNWLFFFICTVGLMLVISLIGFRKYEKIITTQEKKLAHRSKQSALGEMLSYIGHQWRQPLNILSMTIQNIELQNRLGKLDTSMLENQVGLANKNIEYLTQVIEDWRALLISGTTRQTIDLADSISRAISIVSPALENCRIHIENRVAGVFKTHGFVNDLVQLTVNVLLNAKDVLADHEGERIIYISSREENGVVTVMFQDNGGGIPPKILDRLFEAYLTDKDDSGGTGLGLYLCRQLAENLDDGKVWAENREFTFNDKKYFGACIYLQFQKIPEGESV